MLRARGLGKSYGKITALDGFDLDIAAGEIVGLVGHNGAGKTTFVEIVAGLTRPDSGRITIDGVDLARRPRRIREQIGLAPQELGLYLPLTVRENLRLFGDLAGLRRRSLRTAIDETAAALDLTEALDRRVGLLSGGQRRRAQAATALVHRPRLLLLDEPTVGADPATRKALLAVVRRYADAGTAICYTTHYLPELADLGASIAVVSRGRVIARGDQSQLLADLPSEVRLTFAGGADRVVRTTNPSGALTELLATGPAPAAIDIHRPSLDDLYDHLGSNHAA